MRAYHIFLVALLIASVAVADNHTATPTPAPSTPTPEPSTPTPAPATPTPTPAATPAPATPSPAPATTPTPTPTQVATPAETTATPTPAPTATTPTPSATLATPAPTPAATAAPQCTTTKDGFCPVGCSDSSDYDCCTQHGLQWIDGRCQSTSATPFSCQSPPQMPQCAAGQYAKSKFDANNCITGYECITSSTPTDVCPQVPYPADFCRNGKSAPKYDSRGCVTGYDCIQFTQPTCPAQQPSKPSCPSGSMPDPKFDPQGCIIDYGCRLAEGEACPQYYNPVCGSDGKTYSNDCQARSASVSVKRYGSCEEKPFCGNYRCEIGEDQGNCANDCGKPVPQGCRVVKDEHGFERYECEGEYKRACPSIPADAEKRCSQNGGRFTKRTDHSGCDVTFCEFGQEKTSFLQAPAVCHSESEIKQISDKCASVGSPVQISVVGENCKVARCGQKEEQLCHDTSFEVRQDIENKCRNEGFSVISSFDEQGCQILQCAPQQACQRDVPREAHDVCRRQGGELIVKHQDGCVSFVDCVQRGDENEVYVDEVTEVPKPTELLSIALKLEELRVEFDKLAKQTDAIADYYKSTASDEEQRFRRVADMFESAKNKVDEIRQELRSKLDSITTDDLVEVKHDIRYIKDVMMKDIVYFMLSGGEDVKELSSKDKKDCGSSEECFGRSFRVCKSAIFYPEGRRGPKVEITGLEGDSCVMKATMPEEFGPPAGSVPGINPPYEMTCKIKDYALGVNNPEEDIFPHCTGSMVELIKQFGTGPQQQQTQGRTAGQQDFRRQQGFNQPQQFRGQEQFGPPQGQQGFQQGAQQGFQQGVQQGVQSGFQQGITNPPPLP